MFRNPEQPIGDCYMRFHQEKQLILCPIMTFTGWQDQYPFYKPIHPQAIHAIAIDRDGNKRKPFGDRDKSTYGNREEITQAITGFNSMVWNEKKARNLSLKSGIDFRIPDDLRPFEKDLRAMHNLGG